MSDEQEPLIEGQDYYFEDGLMVLTARYLLRRGYCCEHGCRHCPYGYSAATNVQPMKVNNDND